MAHSEPSIPTEQTPITIPADPAHGPALSPDALAAIIHPTESLQSAPLKTIRRSFELLSISSFLATFSQAFGIKHFSIRKLEADLSGSQPDSYVPSLIPKLLVSLTGDRSINSTNWEARLRKEHLRRDPSTNPLGSEPFKPKPKALKRAVGYVYIAETIPVEELYQYPQKLSEQNLVNLKPADPIPSSDNSGIPDQKAILSSISPNSLAQQDRHHESLPTVAPSNETQAGAGGLKAEVTDKFLQPTHPALHPSLPPASVDPEPVDQAVFSTTHPLDTPLTTKSEPPDPNMTPLEPSSPSGSTYAHPIPWPTLSSLTKLQTLHRLCEWHMSTPQDLERFRRLIEAKSSPSDASESEWRHERCGLDGQGNQYWLCGDGTEATLWVERKPPEPPRGAITLRIPARGKKKRGTGQKRKREPGSEAPSSRPAPRAKRPRIVGTRSSSRLKGHQEPPPKPARPPTVIVIKKTAAWNAPPVRRPEPRPRTRGEVWEDVPAGWLDEVVAPPCRAGPSQTACCASPMSSELSEPSDEASDAEGARDSPDGGAGPEGLGAATDTVDARGRAESQQDEKMGSPAGQDSLDMTSDVPDEEQESRLDDLPPDCTNGAVEHQSSPNGRARATEQATCSSDAANGEGQAGVDQSMDDGGLANRSPTASLGEDVATAEADCEAGEEPSGGVNGRSTAGTPLLTGNGDEHAGTVTGECDNDMDLDRTAETGVTVEGDPVGGSSGLMGSGRPAGAADGNEADSQGRSPAGRAGEFAGDASGPAPTPDVAGPSINGTSFCCNPVPSGDATDEPRPAVEPKQEGEGLKVEDACVDPSCPELKGHPLDPEWIGWEVVCSNLDEWERFCLQFEASEQKDEVALVEFVKTEALPLIREAFKAEEARVRMEEAMAQRKRSSRLATREVVQQSALEAAVGERESRMHSERLEAKRRREMESEEASRQQKDEDLRLVRLREREERLLLREAQLAGERQAELQRAERARLRAESKLLGKAVKVAKSGAENSVVTVSDSAEQWELNCEICGVVGVNMDDGSEVICCDKCEQWQHLACHDSADQILGRPKRDWATTDFTCAGCSGRAIPGAVKKLRTHVNGKPKPKPRVRVRARASKAQGAGANGASPEAPAPAKPRLMILMSHPTKDGGNVLSKVSPERCQPSQVAPNPDTDTDAAPRPKPEPHSSSVLGPGPTAATATPPPRPVGAVDLRSYYDDLEKLCEVLRANVNLHRSLPSEVVHRLRRYLVEQQQMRTKKDVQVETRANVDPALSGACVGVGAGAGARAEGCVEAGGNRKEAFAPIGAPLATSTGWYDPAVSDPMPRLEPSREAEIGTGTGTGTGGGGCVDESVGRNGSSSFGIGIGIGGPAMVCIDGNASRSEAFVDDDSREIR